MSVAKNVLEQYQKLRDELAEVTEELDGVPTVKYSYLCRQLSMICLRLGSKKEAIYYLVNSIGYQLRWRALCRLTILSQKNMGESLPIDVQRECIKFNGQYDKSGFNSMMRRLHELPAEWKVVQVSISYSPRSRLENQYSSVCTPGICITTFECGKNAADPLMVTIPEPIDSSIFWNDFTETLKISRQRFDETDPRLHHRKKEEANTKMFRLLRELRDYWFGAWISLLFGRLTNRETAKKVRECVDVIVEDTKVADYFLDRGLEIVYGFVECYSYISEEEFEVGIKSVINDKCPQNMIKNLTVRLSHLCNNMDLKDARRYPVILVLDQELEHFPWEMLDGLAYHPMSRVSSIPLLHALYHAHKERIKDGCVECMFTPEKGFYILNPDNSLPDMQKKLEPFLRNCLKGWQCVVGKSPEPAQMRDALTEKDIFIYFGHGSGGKYLHPYKLAKLNISATVLLFGCNSNSWSYAPFHDRLTTCRAYCISSSPCVLGMLWEMPDGDTNAMTTKLLDAWLSPSSDREPELLRAVIRGRSGARELLTKASMVVRGLPTRILFQEN